MDSDTPVSQALVAPESSQLAEPEPATASIFRRATGWLIDYGIVMIPGVALVLLAMASLVQSLPGYLGSVAAEVGWSHLVRLITSGGAGAGTLGAIASREWILFTVPLIGALLAVPLMQFVYLATLLAWRGRTIGKMVTDTRVGIAVADAPRLSGRRALGRAFSTVLLETGLVSIALVLITIRQISIGGFIWAVAILAFWINAFAALGPRRRTIVDRLAGTIVVRRTLYAEAAKQAVDVAHTMSGAAVTAGRTGSIIAVAAGQKTSEAAVAAGRMTADAAVVAARLAREGNAALMRSAPVQQVLNSRTGQQAQALGAAGADRARQLGGQAASRARQLGGRAQQAWKERQAKHAQAEDEGPHLPDEPEQPTPG